VRNSVNLFHILFQWENVVAKMGSLQSLKNGGSLLLRELLQTGFPCITRGLDNINNNNNYHLPPEG